MKQAIDHHKDRHPVQSTQMHQDRDVQASPVLSAPTPCTHGIMVLRACAVGSRHATAPTDRILYYLSAIHQILRVYLPPLVFGASRNNQVHQSADYIRSACILI
jgi:hypothetical protein